MLDRQGNEVSTVQSMACSVEDIGGGTYSGYQKIAYYAKTGGIDGTIARGGHIVEVSDTNNPITFRVLTDDLTITEQSLSILLKSVD